MDLAGTLCLARDVPTLRAIQSRRPCRAAAAGRRAAETQASAGHVGQYVAARRIGRARRQNPPIGRAAIRLGAPQPKTELDEGLPFRLTPKQSPMPDITLPETLQINAYCGGPSGATGEVAAGARRWALRTRLDDTRHLAPPPPADFRQWWDARVGWGVILPELPDVDPATPDRGEGLPEPMRPFLDARAKQLGRAVPIFRYLKDSPNRSPLLRPRMLQRALSINGSEF